MKAVMISIRPEWCAMIANGRKTIEVRKTKPKLETPFKCYIYCTKPKRRFTHGGLVDYTDELYRLPNGEIRFGYSGELMLYPGEYSKDNFLCGKVIGEFVCDKILDIFISSSDPNMKPLPFPCTGLTDKQIMDYLGNGVTGYGWHISELKIYDKPKELREFCRMEKTKEWAFPQRITKPPQSWCYVEG